MQNILIDLWIPRLPQNLVGPNRGRNDYHGRAAATKQAKVEFSMLLEQVYPPHERRSQPLERCIFYIHFGLPKGLRVDPVNLYGRMKPWEDVLVFENILKDDNFKVVHEVHISREYLDSRAAGFTRWTICDITLEHIRGQRD